MASAFGLLPAYVLPCQDLFGLFMTLTELGKGWVRTCARFAQGQTRDTFGLAKGCASGRFRVSMTGRVDTEGLKSNVAVNGTLAWMPQARNPCGCNLGWVGAIGTTKSASKQPTCPSVATKCCEGMVVPSARSESG